MSLREQVQPGVSRRTDFALRSSKAALLVIDIQKYLSYAEHEYFDQFSFPRAVKSIERLVHKFRSARDNPASATGCEVIFTYLQSVTKDGRDISLDYKLSGPALANIPRVSDGDIFWKDCLPDPHSGKGDILLPKTSCSVFQSTNLDYLLRNLGIEQLVITGQLTDQCVESAVRDAADLGYFVTVVDDACAAYSATRHQTALQSMQGFCRILFADQVLSEVDEDAACHRMNPVSVMVSDTDSISLDAVSAFLRDRGFADAAGELICLLPEKSRLITSPITLHPGSQISEKVEVSRHEDDKVERLQNLNL